MKVSYINSEIEDLCKQQKKAFKKLGAESAKKLQHRVNELFAASVVSELTIGRPHPLKRDRDGQFSVDLYKGKRLIFKPSKVPPPTKEDGSIDWNAVDDVTIIAAEDYHD